MITPAFVFILTLPGWVWIAKKFKMWRTDRGDRVKVRAKRKQSGEQDSLNRGCNVFRVESVTQLIAC